MARLANSENMLNEIFSYLPGHLIIHKIALLNRRIRLALTKLVPFGEGRIITLKISSLDFTFHKCLILEKGVFGDSQTIRGKTGLDLRVIKKFLDFTNNLSFQINDCNF